METKSTPELIARSIEIFLHGFTFTRSYTHPYVTKQFGPLWVMRDGPRKRDNYRVEEWLAYGTTPAEIDRIARQHTRGRFTICAIVANGEDPAPLRTGFKELDYRLHSTEPLMVHHLEQISVADAPALIQRVETLDLLDRVNKAARARQILSEHLEYENPLDAPIREYAALVDDEVVGWVGSILLQGETRTSTWVTNMYVKADFRRRGIASALMTRMLHDDRAAGANESILLASHVGAKLYPVVGYKQIGTLFIYTPKKRDV